MASTILFDMARMTTGTTGTGTITLGSAVSSFLTFAQAGVTNGQTVRYGIEDGTSREVGTGVYTSSGTTLTRTVIHSTNSDAAINLSGVAQVFLTALAEDITNKTGDTMTGALNWATTVTLASAATVNIGAAASNYISITGVATITAFDTIAAGAERSLVFAGALTITNSANIICLGGANITTAAGDTAIFTSEGSGIWRMTGYHRNTGSGITPAADIRTASATITIPSGATKLKVTLVGGGGGGGGAASSVSGGYCPQTVPGQGGAGGCGGAIVKYLSGLTPGNTLALTIGAAGSGGAAGNNAGGNGGDSTLASGSQSITTLTASKGNGGAAGNSVIGADGAGGTGTNGDLNITGQATNAGGASTGFGIGLGGESAVNSNGTAATGYGGGGGGGYDTTGAGTKAGGAGTAGCAIFEWYI